MAIKAAGFTKKDNLVTLNLL